MTFTFELPEKITLESLNAKEVRAEIPKNCTLNHYDLLLFLMLEYLGQANGEDSINLYMDMLQEDVLPLAKKESKKFSQVVERGYLPAGHPILSLSER